MLIGYARVSTKGQNEDRQLEQFKDLGLSLDSTPKQIYIDKQTGRNFERPEYQNMLKALRPGDTLVITSLDRLGRNYKETGDQFSALVKRGIKVKVLDMPYLNTDQDNPLIHELINDIIVKVFLYVADDNYQKIKENQKQGIKVAKEKGVRFGRPKVDREKIDLAKYYMALGYSTAKACKTANLNRKTYYNHLKETA